MAYRSEIQSNYYRSGNTLGDVPFGISCDLFFKTEENLNDFLSFFKQKNYDKEMPNLSFQYSKENFYLFLEVDFAFDKIDLKSFLSNSFDAVFIAYEILKYNEEKDVLIGAQKLKVKSIAENIILEFYETLLSFLEGITGEYYNNEDYYPIEEDDIKLFIEPMGLKLEQEKHKLSEWNLLNTPNENLKDFLK